MMQITNAYLLKTYISVKD